MVVTELTIDLPDERATIKYGRLLGSCLRGGEIVYLHGTLGAGKTTFCRGVLAAWGHQGTVKSPTYTLVEPYVLDAQRVYHFDLYRLGDPEELEFIGVRDYFDGQSLVLIEWPERGQGMLAKADLHIEILLNKHGRTVQVRAETEKAGQVLKQLQTKTRQTE